MDQYLIYVDRNLFIDHPENKKEYELEKKKKSKTDI